MERLSINASKTNGDYQMTFEEQSKMITNTFVDAKVDLLNDLLMEIGDEGYDIAQLRGSLLNHIESFEKLRVKYV